MLVIGQQVRGRLIAFSFMQGRGDLSRRKGHKHVLRMESEGRAMARMNWRRAQLYGRPTLDKRFEFDVPDRAERWLQAVSRAAPPAATARTRITAPSSAAITMRSTGEMET